jgi:molecular chaperone GrpE (heat shock protein)
MKFTSKRTLQEEVVIRPYSVQAIARKRNMMMNALQLNDSEFMNWVRDRMYRVAEQNKISIKELPMDLVSAGFQEWENKFRQSDKDFDQYKQQFMEYSQKFMKFASQISGEAITNPNPGQLTPSADAVPPVSPKMIKFQASDNVKQ